MTNSETGLNTANVFGVFASIQGEGIYLGCPQIFIRFTGCNIRCSYCDTVDALLPQAIVRIEQTPFSGNMKLVPNPISAETLAGFVKHLTDSFIGFHSISLTGGEPLMYAGFLKKLLPLLKLSRLEIFLETNGTLPEQLEKIINEIDIISMDIKIPCDIQKGKLDWNKTEKFLQIARQRKCFIKVIISNQLGAKLNEEFITASDIIARISPEISVVLQPAFYETNQPSRRYAGADIKRMLEVYQIFRTKVKDVRIIPQVHKLIGWN